MSEILKKEKEKVYYSYIISCCYNNIQVKHSLFILDLVFISLIIFSVILIRRRKIVYIEDDINNNTKYIIPKIVWIFWEGNMVNMTRYMLHQIKTINKDYKLIFLNKDTVRNYVNTFTINDNITSLSLAPQADYYRLYLIYNYGGIWLDCHTYIRDEEYFNNNLKEMKEKEAELLAYNSFYPPMNNIEVGVLFAPLHSEFIRRVLKEWEYGMYIGREKYMEDAINKGLVMRSKKLYNPEGDDGKPIYNSYFFTYYCLQSVLQFQYHEKANIIIKRSEDWFFKFRNDCDGNVTIMNERWNNDPSSKDYPIITITHRVRRKMKSEGATII